MTVVVMYVSSIVLWLWGMEWDLNPIEVLVIKHRHEWINLLDKKIIIASFSDMPSFPFAHGLNNVMQIDIMEL